MPDNVTPPLIIPQVLNDEVRHWRAVHPHATMTEIEQFVDARLHAMRATWRAELAREADDREARCPTCGGPLQPRGDRSRTLRTQGNASIPLTRHYGVCPVCGIGLFPPR